MSDEPPILDPVYVGGESSRTIDTSAWIGTYVGLNFEVESKPMREYAEAHPKAEVLYVNAVLVCECGKRHRLRFGPDKP
mgnify:CR=1 FL=1